MIHFNDEIGAATVDGVVRIGPQEVFDRVTVSFDGVAVSRGETRREAREFFERDVEGKRSLAVVVNLKAILLALELGQLRCAWFDNLELERSDLFCNLAQAALRAIRRQQTQGLGRYRDSL